MKIIAGLGNPGLKYRNTRHNTGVIVLKELARRNSVPVRKKGFGGVYGIGRYGGIEIMLFEPRTYMNLSGEALRSVCESKLIGTRDLLVISDDIDLPLGRIRLREKGSAGGHNGLRSVIHHMGADFARLRVGIGSDGRVEDMSGYVLSSFTRAERPLLEEGIQKAASCAEMWLEEDIKDVMSRYNAAG